MDHYVIFSCLIFSQFLPIVGWHLLCTEQWYLCEYELGIMVQGGMMFDEMILISGLIILYEMYLFLKKVLQWNF